MNVPSLLLGRILLSVPFLAFGLMHLFQADKLAGVVPAWMPGGIALVYVSGLAELLAAVAFLTGRYAALAGQLTALLLFIFVATIHLPGVLNGTDPMMVQMSMAGILKDFGLAGGALLFSHIFSSRS